VKGARSLRKGDFFLPREVEWSIRTFGVHSDELEQVIYEFTKPIQSTGCWEWQGGKSGDGYGRMYCNGVYEYAHRVSQQLFNGPLTPERPHALHRCDNPPCVCPDHLWAGSASDNARDREAKGRGGSAVQALSADQAAEIVREVTALRAAGFTQAEIGARFGKSQSWASSILSKREAAYFALRTGSEP
jgi:hypothetical protein